MKNILLGSLLLSLVLTSCKNKPEEENKDMLENLKIAFIGTYTRMEGHVEGKAEGIYTLYQDPESGSLRFGEVVAKITNPSFVRVSEDGKNLYAVTEIGSREGEVGEVYAYSINDNYELEELNKLSTEAGAPAQIAIDQSGKYVFVANYMGGVVMMYRREEDGRLSDHKKIQLENPGQSHAHSVNIDEDNEHVYIADLGNDKIWIFDLDAATGSIEPNEQAFVEVEEGAGPRHFTFSKNQEYAYVINELNSSITAFKRKASGGLEIIQTVSTLPEDFEGENSAADIHLHPNGKFIYGSNRGDNSICAFRVGDDGKLINIGFYPTNGETPRNFAIAPGGDFLYAANQDSGGISIFKIDGETGELEQELTNFDAKTPVCIEFVEN
ncbi:lactonase family protein [Zunongwangia sp. F363]|uniref:Lactonase family protein n=1 Tax=Autumnicola tepida TaxID=3075595 RepID=A0ABU3CCA0_9FLAO|nr:lactonase family protein [Zunongwangia sp. F363]MDT0643971.1 lactonase family protein [Zunongwangia sp. F363]